MVEGLRLIKIDLEEGRGEGAPLFFLDGTLDEFKKVMCDP
jgi:hypothetical protein